MIGSKSLYRLRPVSHELGKEDGEHRSEIAREVHDACGTFSAVIGHCLKLGNCLSWLLPMVGLDAQDQRLEEIGLH
jgi:hypothetical protein